MAESQNFKELLLVLNDHLVEYLIVGGYMDPVSPGYVRNRCPLNFIAGPDPQ